MAKKRDVALGLLVVDNTGVPPLDEARAARGKQLYLQCAGCHGTGGSTPILPNLARVKALGRDGLAAILNGALEQNGMPSFGDSLSAEDVDVLFDYISRGLHNQPVQHVWY